MNDVMDIKRLIQSEKFHELVRFVIVGVTATFLHYAIYWLLKHWINYNIAYTLGYAISFVGNYYMTTYFTFKKKASISKGVAFGGAHLLNYVLQLVMLNALIYLGIDKTWAPIPVYMIVIPLQFLLVRFVIKK